MIRRLPKKLLIAGGGLIIVLIGIWFYRTSFIEVNVTNGGNSPLTYVFRDERTGKSGQVESSSSQIKRRLPKGNYEVEVRQDTKSYVAVVKTKGFLGKVTIRATLSPESKRAFIGNNPSSCMAFSGIELVSYTCGDMFKNVRVHVPATATSPTFVTSLARSAISGQVYQIVDSSSGLYALVKSGGYYLYRLDGKLNVLDTIVLSNLSSDKQYSMKPSGQGFMIYDSSLDNAFIYSGMDSSPRHIKLNKPARADLEPIFMDSLDGNFLSIYSNETDADSNTGREPHISDLVISLHGQVSDYKFKQSYITGQFCGNYQVCLLGDSKMDVYYVGGQKPVLQFSMGGVSSIDRVGTSTLIVNKTGILNLDIAKRSGYYEYTFGGYKFNTLQPSVNGGYILNLTNDKLQAVALLINPASPNKDNIDKKIVQLHNRPEVSSVSIYGKYIYISPNLGQPSYQASIGGYGYDPQTIRQVNDQLNTDIKRIGIDTTVYKIINLYD